MILLIIFLHNRERHSIKTHTLAQRGKKHKEVCIDFLSGVCFAFEGQFNESTSRVPEGETMNQRQKTFSAFCERHRPWVTGMVFSPGRDLNSQPQLFHWGEAFRDLGPSLCAMNHTTRDSSNCSSRRRGITNVLEKKNICPFGSIQG